ncbi:hypothetical protein KP509_16G003200 [Ceratopteris richardii]|uniref:Uncharacterized protein n=1 Tax=Ceratopteris richardii TaxID=49495 RepID=A0A8T2T0J6_CERRI|nr:hypothetical protein KP509_16G003200 [Ceratopteris richardii]
MAIPNMFATDVSQRMATAVTVSSLMLRRSGKTSFWVGRVPAIEGSTFASFSSSAIRRPFSVTKTTAIRSSSGAGHEPLDLTPDNVERVLIDARSELLQLFDTSVGITGCAELADIDGPFLKLRLSGRFWHQREVVLARLANYLQKRIPEIMDVQIEDESQLDDSPANFGL